MRKIIPNHSLKISSAGDSRKSTCIFPQFMVHCIPVSYQEDELVCPINSMNFC